MAYHRRVDVLNGTAAKGTYYDVNKAAEVQNKTRATYKTCNYNAFLFKKDTNKWTFLKGIQTHQTKLYKIDEDHNCKTSEYITLKIAVSYHLKISAYYDS